MPKPNRRTKTYKSYVFVPIDGSWSWIVCIICCVLKFVCSGCIYTFGMYIGTFADKYEVSVGKVSVVPAVFYLCMNLISPVVAATANVIGYRILPFFGGLIGALGYIICVLEHKSFVLFVFSNGVLGGVGIGVLLITSKMLLNFYFHNWRYCTIFASNICSSLGLALIPLFLDYENNKRDWKISYFIIAGFLILCSVMILFCAPMEPNKLLDSVSTFQELDNITNTGNIRSSINSPTVDKVMDIKQMSVHRSMIDESNCSKYCNLLRSYELDLNIRPMFRDDIFYSGSLIYVDEYRRILGQQHSIMDIRNKGIKLLYSISVTRIHKYISRCDLFIYTLKRLTDFKIYKKTSFHLYIYSNVLILSGDIVVLFHITQYARSNSITDTSWLLFTIGMAYIIGTIVLSLLLKFRGFNLIIYIIILTTINGIATFFFAFPTYLDKYYQYIYAVIFGYSFSCSETYSFIAIHLYKLEKLTNVCGLLQIFKGIGCFLILLLCAAILEYTNNKYLIIFCIAGCCHILGGIFLLIVKFVRAWERKINLSELSLS